MRLGNTICTRPIVLQVPGVRFGLGLYNETGEHNMYQAHCVSVPGVRLGLGLYNETGEHNMYQAHCIASPRRTVRVRVI